MASKSNLSVVIDIGTSKLVALAGRVTELGKMEILGVAKTPSKGIKRGVIFNLADVIESITKVLGLLDDQLEDEIEVVDVAYAGKEMKTVNYQASRFTGEGGVVSNFDIDELYNEAKNVELKSGYRILKVIPTSFVIDDEIEELKPVGVTGKKIEARYKLVVIPEVDLINLQRVFESVGVELGEVYHSSLAIAEAVLPKHEKEMGTVVLDMGAGTSNLAVFYENSLVHTAVIPFAGEVITNDLKCGCATFMEKAELLKVKYGQALGDQIKSEDTVTIAKNNGWEPKEITIKSLAYIIQARLEEIVEIVNSEIEKSGVKDLLGTGIVVTGGTSSLENIITLVKYHTGMDARMAYSVVHPVNRKDEVKSPDMYTALGALKLALTNVEAPVRILPEPGNKSRSGKSIFPNFKGALQSAINFFDDGSEDLELK
ncbi:cell division protein FtsA [uncultured Draconibacterium sp.]|uniref:cell division protein FtsA n=1 Tax=uncultured Draconibacterium sp. TaxID=1573823 RepID=UPI003217F12B